MSQVAFVTELRRVYESNGVEDLTEELHHHSVALLRSVLPNLLQNCEAAEILRAFDEALEVYSPNLSNRHVYFHEIVLEDQVNSRMLNSCVRLPVHGNPMAVYRSIGPPRCRFQPALHR